MVTLVLATICTIGLRPVRGESNAEAATREFVDQALQIFRDNDKPVVQKRRELKPLIEARLDATEMARSTLGYHWPFLSPDQRANFTRVFTSFIEAAYLDKVEEFRPTSPIWTIAFARRGLL